MSNPFPDRRPPPRRTAHRTPRHRTVLALALLLGLAVFNASMWIASSAFAGAAGNPDFDPVTGYRIAHYRMPTPPDVPGGTVVDIEQVDRLLSSDRAILIDVMATEGPGADSTTGQWSLAKPHFNIAGSSWLADVGRGAIDARLEAYFRDQLAALTGGDTARPIIIYCQSDCWMAWNAVQRAAKWGYSRLYWYRDGVDGWRDWDRPLVAATPLPMPGAPR